MGAFNKYNPVPRYFFFFKQSKKNVGIFIAMMLTLGAKLAKYKSKL